VLKLSEDTVPTFGKLQMRCEYIDWVNRLQTVLSNVKNRRQEKEEDETQIQTTFNALHKLAAEGEYKGFLVTEAENSQVESEIEKSQISEEDQSPQDESDEESEQESPRTYI